MSDNSDKVISYIEVNVSNKMDSKGVLIHTSLKKFYFEGCGQ